MPRGRVATLPPLEGLVTLDTRVAKFQWTCDRCGRIFWSDGSRQGLGSARKHRFKQTCTKRKSPWTTLEEWERALVAKRHKNSAVAEPKVAEPKVGWTRSGFRGSGGSAAWSSAVTPSPLQPSSARCCELTAGCVVQPQLHPVPDVIARAGAKQRAAETALETVAKFAHNPPHLHVLTAVRARPPAPCGLRHPPPARQLTWNRWTHWSAGAAKPCWTRRGRVVGMRVVSTLRVRLWRCCCLHSCATAERGWGTSPRSATHVLRPACQGAEPSRSAAPPVVRVGAACHPQPRVTGVANRLTRRPCFEGELMLCYFFSQ